ncbi:IS1 family transposase, partial [Escherichia coli]
MSIRCPSCSATEVVLRYGKSTTGHRRYIGSERRQNAQLP